MFDIVDLLGRPGGVIGERTRGDLAGQITRPGVVGDRLRPRGRIGPGEINRRRRREIAVGDEGDTAAIRLVDDVATSHRDPARDAGCADRRSDAQRIAGRGVDRPGVGGDGHAAGRAHHGNPKAAGRGVGRIDRNLRCGNKARQGGRINAGILPRHRDRHQARRGGDGARRGAGQRRVGRIDDIAHPEGLDGDRTISRDRPLDRHLAISPDRARRRRIHRDAAGKRGDWRTLHPEGRIDGKRRSPVDQDATRAFKVTGACAQ